MPIPNTNGDSLFNSIFGDLPKKDKELLREQLTAIEIKIGLIEETIEERNGVKTRVLSQFGTQDNITNRW